MNRSIRSGVSPRPMWTLCLLAILILCPVRVQAAPQSTAIGYGTFVSGTIESAGELDSYTFTGTEHDRILIGVSNVSGNLWPRIRLYGPKGILLASAYQPDHAEISRELPPIYSTYLPLLLSGNRFTVAALSSDPEVAIPVSAVPTAEGQGTYTIIVDDGFNGTFTGSYTLYLQKLNPPSAATAIVYGQILNATAELPGSMDAFTFSAAAGDRILIGESHVSGDVWMRIRLYDPNGSLQGDVHTSSRHDELSFTIQGNGLHTILVSDGFDGTFTGDYTLYLQKLNPPSAATAIVYGQILNATAELPGSMDAFTFSAAAGDRILIGESHVSGNVWMRIRLYDPNGSLQGDVHTSSRHDELSFTIQSNGLHTILVNDGFDGTFTGDYTLYLQRVNGPGNATSISSGQLLSGSISVPGDIDTFTFAGAGGSTVLITMTHVSGNVWPRIRLYGPDGVLLADEQDNSTQTQITRLLPSSGTYTILAGDGFDGTFTGDYNLGLQGVP